MVCEGLEGAPTGSKRRVRALGVNCERFGAARSLLPNAPKFFDCASRTEEGELGLVVSLPLFRFADPVCAPPCPVEAAETAALCAYSDVCSVAVAASCGHGYPSPRNLPPGAPVRLLADRFVVPLPTDGAIIDLPPPPAPALCDS